MIMTVVNIYDFLKKHPFLGWGVFFVSSVVLTWLVLRLNYKEDISDFLPLDEDSQTALSVYQDISGANNIFAVIARRDTANMGQEELAAGVDCLVDEIQSADSLGLVSDMIYQVDMDKMSAVATSLYDNMPLFLTDGDYDRIDSLLSSPAYVEEQLAKDKEMMLFPSSSFLGENVSRDPLNLFTPVLNRLSRGGLSVDYDTYDSYILTPDGSKAVVIVRSAFGANESEGNRGLVSLLNNAADKVKARNGNLDIHIIGGPVIAVSNASQIKEDSLLAVCIAGMLILALLIYVFRNARNILLIAVSVGWGWLFAMGGISICSDSVSIIVIGIASVILGIAINYPLHLIDHLRVAAHPRTALWEIVSPLIVGNVTTVGAFLALVPLNSPALHDLGLFSSLLLVGTILFVLVFLPHVVKSNKPIGGHGQDPVLITKIAGISLENRRWLVWTVLALTLVFGYFSLFTEFDSDMRNINYMTQEHKADFDYFKTIFNQSTGTETLYVVSSGKSWEEALRKNEAIDVSIDSLVQERLATRSSSVSSFLSSESRQEQKLQRWRSMVEKHWDVLTAGLVRSGVSSGFSENAFDEFKSIIEKDYSPVSFSEYGEIVSAVFAANTSEDKDSGRKSIVQTVEVKAGDVERVKNSIRNSSEFGGLVFDVRSMNGAIADTLSDDFNYIGIACGCIVFFFLWFSFGNIELAIVSFIPMAVSWLWILGVMGVLGIKFNIVNVILATFIFGQGDDYTIFMTEGLSYEYAYRKRMLASYKNSIVVSALIMFIGIGTLVFAKHPALKSLGEVTVVGMASVVLMAYLFPPLIFNWLVRKKGRVRFRPVTVKKILCTGYCATVFFVQLVSAYVLGFFLFVVTKPSAKKRMLFHRYYCSVFRFDIKRMPGICFSFKNESHEDFSKPAVVICNHQSLLDSFCMMSVSPRIILVANEHVRVNPVIRFMFRWCGFLSVADGIEGMAAKITPLISEGYSIAVFPEGERPAEFGNEVKRFHKGAFCLAESMGLDIVPVFFGGVQQIMPKGSALSNGGPMRVEIGKRVSRAQLDAMGDALDQTKAMRGVYRERVRSIHSEIYTTSTLKRIVYDRYLYKGREIESRAKKALSEIMRQSDVVAGVTSAALFVDEPDSQGELALMLALMYPDKPVSAYVGSEEGREIFAGCIDGFVRNVRLASHEELLSADNGDAAVFRFQGGRIEKEDRNSNS